MSKPMNVLFLMTDQHRLDHVSLYGNSKVATPNIDRLGQSVAFRNCATVNPICTPARTALLTGKYTHQIGTLAMSGDLSRQHPTYLRAMQKAGYYTAAVGKLHWLQGWRWKTAMGLGHNLAGLNEETKKYGLDYVWEIAGKQLAVRNYCDYCKHLDGKGLLEKFRVFIDKGGKNTRTAHDQEFTGEAWPLPEEDYIDTICGEKIIEAIRKRPKDKPMMLFGSFSCPHPPFDPPQRYMDKVPYEKVDDFVVVDGDKPLTPAMKKTLYRLRQAYKASILLVDDMVGRIMDTLAAEGIADNTLICFTSDHGEFMGDRDMMHKQEPWWQCCHVPCLVRHPKHLRGEINDSPVEIIDVTATILEAAGLDPKKALSTDWPAFENRVPARSLMPIVRGEKPRVRDFAFSECNGLWQMVMDERWKYIRWLDYKAPGERPEALFDRLKDPNELVNLAADPAVHDVLDRCRKRCDFVNDTTPPAQLRWAPVIDQNQPIVGE